MIHLGSPRIYYDTLKLVKAIEIASKKIPTIRMIFLGADDSNYTNVIRQYVTERNLTQNINFEPPVPHSEIGRQLSKAKIGVHTYSQNNAYRMTVGTKIYEYLGAGVPIAHMGPRGSEVERLIVANNVGIFAASAHDYAEKLVGLISDGDALRQSRKNAIDMASRFEWSKIVHNVYRSCINLNKQMNAIQGDGRDA